MNKKKSKPLTVEWTGRHRMYVAPSLHSLLVPSSNHPLDDIEFLGEHYRKLDMQYWLWVETRFAIEHNFLTENRNIDKAASLQFDFNRINWWASKVFLKRSVDKMRRGFKFQEYQPPVSSEVRSYS